MTALMQRHPTYVGLVYEYLLAKDDFATVQELTNALRLSRKHVFTSLLMLREYKAVDSIIEAGVTYWCSTPHSDTRTKTVKEIAHHTRRPKRKKVVVEKAPLTSAEGGLQ